MREAFLIRSEPIRMSVHYLLLQSPTGSPIRTVVSPDGTRAAWPAPARDGRPLRMHLIDPATTPASGSPPTLVDAQGRPWIHPVHRPVSLCDEGPSPQVVWLDPRGRVRA